MVSLVEEGEGSAASSSENLPTEQQIQKLRQQINRQFAIDDYKGAVAACEELCSLISTRYNELHDECAEPYYQYATALLEVARDENQLLGTNRIPQEEEEEREEEEEEDGPDSTEKPEAEQGPPEEGEGEEEDDVTSLQIAWEVLELSRIIYARQSTPEAQRKLAKVKIKLGEVSMENEKMDEAVVQFKEAIDHFVAGGENPDSREISSTYYMMGLASSLDQKYEDAIKHFSDCSKLMQSQISRLEGASKESLEQMKEEVDKMISDCKDSLRQLEVYRKLIPTQSSAAEASGSCDSSSSSSLQPSSSSSTSSSFPATTTSSSPFPSSTSSAPVSNISHLVRKRPVSQPVQPMTHAAPSSTSEITSKLGVKPTVRVSPMVSSSTSPQTDRQTNGRSANSNISSSNGGIQSSEVQSTASPAHAVAPTSSSQRTGVSSTTAALESRLAGSSSGFGFESRLAGSTSGFGSTVTDSTSFGMPGSTSGGIAGSFSRGMAGSSTDSRISESTSEARASGSQRQVATVSSVQRTEEAISSSSDFKRPAGTIDDMGNNEAKRSRQ